MSNGDSEIKSEAVEPKEESATIATENSAVVAADTAVPPAFMYVSSEAGGEHVVRTAIKRADILKQAAALAAQATGLAYGTMYKYFLKGSTVVVESKSAKAKGRRANSPAYMGTVVDLTKCKPKRVDSQGELHEESWAVYPQDIKRLRTSPIVDNNDAIAKYLKSQGLAVFGEESDDMPLRSTPVEVEAAPCQIQLEDELGGTETLELPGKGNLWLYVATEDSVPVPVAKLNLESGNCVIESKPCNPVHKLFYSLFSVATVKSLFSIMPQRQ